MSLLFFEGFNIQNTDQTPYLDPRYWSRPYIDVPFLEFKNANGNLYPDNMVHIHGTDGSLRVSGHKLDVSPPQPPLPLQLSGVSGLDSDHLYISFRISNLGHEPTIVSSYPYQTKFLTFNSGVKELLSFDVVRTTGLSVQGGTWQYQDQGLGISVKQTGIGTSMVQIGLFDLRVFGINDYYIINDNDGSNNGSTSIKRVNGNIYVPRFVHLEFYLNRLTNSIRMKIEGFDVANKLGPLPLKYAASGKPFGIFDNIKFYSKGTIPSEQGSVSNEYGAIILDDLAICNNSGDTPNVWMGPNTRVMNLSTATYSPGLNDWSNSVGSTSTRLDTNDGDNSYIFSDISGNIYSNQLRSSSLYLYNSADPEQARLSILKDTDKIGGIRVFNSVRKAFLDSDFVNIYGTGYFDELNNEVKYDDTNSYVNIGEHYQVDHTDYIIRNSFVLRDPTKNDVWSTGDMLYFNVDHGAIATTGYVGVKKL